MDKKINIHPAGDVVAIYEGRASKPIEPGYIYIYGDINTPANYLAAHADHQITKDGILVPLIDQRYAHALIEKKTLTITLTLNEGQENGRVQSQIVGRMEIDSKFAAFKINTPYRWGLKEMANFLKFNRRFFNEPTVAAEIVTALTNFSGSVQKDIEQKQDDRGNRRSLLDKRVTSNIPDTFALTVQLFEGGGFETINVELCIEEGEGAVRCWLQSVDAEEKMEAILQAEMTAQDIAIGKENVLVIWK